MAYPSAETADSGAGVEEQKKQHIELLLKHAGKTVIVMNYAEKIASAYAGLNTPGSKTAADRWAEFGRGWQQWVDYVNNAVSGAQSASMSLDTLQKLSKAANDVEVNLQKQWREMTEAYDENGQLRFNVAFNDALDRLDAVNHDAEPSGSAYAAMDKALEKCNQTLGKISNPDIAEEIRVSIVNPYLGKSARNATLQYDPSKKMLYVHAHPRTDIRDVEKKRKEIQRRADEEFKKFPAIREMAEKKMKSKGLTAKDKAALREYGDELEDVRKALREVGESTVKADEMIANLEKLTAENRKTKLEVRAQVCQESVDEWTKHATDINHVLKHYPGMVEYCKDNEARQKALNFDACEEAMDPCRGVYDKNGVLQQSKMPMSLIIGQPRTNANYLEYDENIRRIINTLHMVEVVKPSIQKYMSLNGVSE